MRAASATGQLADVVDDFVRMSGAPSGSGVTVLATATLTAAPGGEGESFSQTVNRPEFRELAAFEFTDVVGSRATHYSRGVEVLGELAGRIGDGIFGLVPESSLIARASAAIASSTSCSARRATSPATPARTASAGRAPPPGTRPPARRGKAGRGGSIRAARRRSR